MNGYLPRGSAGNDPHGVEHREFGRLGLEKRIIRMKNLIQIICIEGISSTKFDTLIKYAKICHADGVQ